MNKDPTNDQMSENFNLIKLHCIGCGSDDLEKDIPRVRGTTFEDKIEGNVVVCEQFIKMNDRDLLEQNRRFIIPPARYSLALRFAYILLF